MKKLDLDIFDSQNNIIIRASNFEIEQKLIDKSSNIILTLINGRGLLHLPNNNFSSINKDLSYGKIVNSKLYNHFTILDLSYKGDPWMGNPFIGSNIMIKDINLTIQVANGRYR